MNANVTVLQPGERFQMGHIIYTVESADLAADRYTLSATYKRRPYLTQDGKPRNWRWTITYVSHLLSIGTATLNPVERCELCGEPDDSAMAEIVVRARSLIVHEGCAVAHAAKLNVPLDSILA